MAAFAAHLSQNDRWAVVEFLRIIVFLSPADYKELAENSARGEEKQRARFAAYDDYGFRQLTAEGNAVKGKQLLRGRITCHAIS